MGEGTVIDSESLGSQQVDLPSREELQRLLNGEDWQALRPNIDRQDALSPADLSFEQVSDIVSVLGSSEVIEKFAFTAGISRVIPFEQRDLPDVGQLKSIDRGGSKCAFLLTTESGKKMAVILQAGFNGSLQIPSDPKISLDFAESFQQWRVQHHVYSDLRTYLTLPLVYRDRFFGIRFQEYGGSEHLNDWALLTIPLAKRQAREYITKRGYSVTDESDFDKSAHWLLPRGKIGWPAVIDVPIKHKRYSW